MIFSIYYIVGMEKMMVVNETHIMWVSCHVKVHLRSVCWHHRFLCVSITSFGSYRDRYLKPWFWVCKGYLSCLVTHHRFVWTSVFGFVVLDMYGTLLKYLNNPSIQFQPNMIEYAPHYLIMLYYVYNVLQDSYVCIFYIVSY